MIACPRCRTPLADDAKFCGSCGHRLDGAPTGAQQTPGAGGRINPLAQTMMAGGNMPRPMPQPLPQQPMRPQAPPMVNPNDPKLAPELETYRAPPAAPKGPPPAAPDRLIGSVLNGRYRVEDKLGEGGFGAVYRGTQLNINREVALKVLHYDLQSDANVVARFMREAQAASGLRDAHTIATFDFDKTPDGTMYIAMELLKGRSIHAVLKEVGPFDWQRVLRIVDMMCSSLGEAHLQGIVHRDIKPENIYLEQRPGFQDYVKVLDFGIAKIVKGEAGSNSNQMQLTAMGQTLGTLEYMSPEQLMGQPLDGRSDIYAMGVLGYEMLTGQLPFPHARSPGVLITAQLRETPKPPSQVRPQSQIPPQVDQLIARMLGKKKEERFLDVNALRTEIGGLINTGQSQPYMIAQPQPPPPSSQQQATMVDRPGRPALLSGPQGLQQGMQGMQQGMQQPMPPPAMMPPRVGTPPAAGKSKTMIYVIAAAVVVAAVLAIILATRH